MKKDLRILMILPNYFGFTGDAINERKLSSYVSKKAKTYVLCFIGINFFIKRKIKNKFKKQIADNNSKIIYLFSPMVFYPFNLLINLFYSLIFIPFLIIVFSKLNLIDVIYVRDSLFALGAVFFKPIHGKKVTMKFGAFISNELTYRKRTPKLYIKINKIAESKTIKGADILFVPSELMAKTLILGFGINKSKIYQLPTGVDLKSFVPIKNRFDLHYKYIGYVGSLTEWQGIKILVEAMKYVQESFPEARLLIIGDGPLRKEILYLIKKFKINAKLIPEVDHNQIPKLLNFLEVLVIPRKSLHSTDTVLPIKFLEACAVGIPVVVSNTKIFENLAKRGLIKVKLFKSENSKDLYYQIVDLLSDSRLREEMTDYNKIFIKNYDWRKISDNFIKVLKIA